MKYLKLFEAFDKEEYDKILGMKVSAITDDVNMEFIVKCIRDNDISGLRTMVKNVLPKDYIKKQSKNIINSATYGYDNLMSVAVASYNYSMEMIDYLLKFGCDFKFVELSNMELNKEKSPGKRTLNFELLKKLMERGYKLSIEELSENWYLENPISDIWSNKGTDFVIWLLENYPEYYKEILNYYEEGNIPTIIKKKFKNLERSGSLGLLDAKTK